jgi:DNA-binding response OmpR family regulator
VARHFIEINKGSIRVESVSGAGTQFFIGLPASEGPGLQAEVPKRNMTGPVTPDVWESLPLDKLMKIRGRKVLIVEDDDEVRAYLNMVLSGHFEIFEAATGEKGLTMAQAPLPDIIISDLLMPGMSGLQFCRNIKQNPLTSHIPVIILTGQWDEDTKVAGYSAGANMFLTKPVKKDLLVQVMINLLLQREQQQEKVMGGILVNETLTAGEHPLSKTDEAFLKNLIALTESRIGDVNFDARVICREMGISRTVLYDKIKAITGKTVHEFIRWVRLKTSVRLLLEGSMPVNQVAFEVGFNSHSYFDKCFLREFGVGPKEYVARRRNGGRG